MPRETLNKINPCARILAEMAKTCFLIGEETDFHAQFTWAAHVNELQIYVTPKGASIDHAVLEFNDYINIPEVSQFMLSSHLGEATYPRVKRFAAELKAFHQNRLEA